MNKMAKRSEKLIQYLFHFFFIHNPRQLGGEVPSTMTKEWQEASNEYARANKINPISGISSENYQGTGFVSGSKA